MPKLIIHIGMGKAASTTIQREVMKVDSAPYCISRNNQTADYVRYGSQGFWWRGLLSSKPDISTLAIEKLNKLLATTSDTIFLSDEVFSSSMYLVNNLVENCKSIQAKVAFLLITRCQSDFLSSLYNHSMRTRIIGLGFPRLNTRAVDKMGYEGNIDSWVSDLFESEALGDNNVLNILDYSRIFDLVSKKLPDASMLALPLELLKMNPCSFVAQFSDFLNMRPAEVENSFSKRQNLTGNRIDDYKGGYFLKKIINNRFARYFKNIGLDKATVQRTIVSILSVMRLGNTQVISTENKDRIINYYLESNQRLQKNIDVDLKSLGYRL
jgi:hypothetical protein